VALIFFVLMCIKCARVSRRLARGAAGLGAGPSVRRQHAAEGCRPGVLLEGVVESGAFATVSELAAAENLNGSYVSHVLRLRLLAPDLIVAILHGRQPATMQLQPLVRSISDSWIDQRCMFA
jgi:hypothetical protein